MKTEQSRAELLKHLAEKMRAEKVRVQQTGVDRPTTASPSTRLSPELQTTELESLFPIASLLHGGMIEVLQHQSGSGATAFSCQLGSQLAPHLVGGTFVIVDRAGTYFPIAAQQAGIPLHRTVVLRPQNDRDEIWAIEQSLRCAGVAIVLCWLSEVPMRMGRRLMLASEVGQTTGIVLRPQVNDRREGTSCWSTIQLRVSPDTNLNSSTSMMQVEDPSSQRRESLQRTVQVEVLRVRGTGFQQRSLRMQLGTQSQFTNIAGRQTSTESRHEARTVCLASELASTDPTTASARAS